MTARLRPGVLDGGTREARGRWEQAGEIAGKGRRGGGGVTSGMAGEATHPFISPAPALFAWLISHQPAVLFS
jgi:hypothetical protein